jgi:uncharacterized protein HemX
VTDPYSGGPANWPPAADPAAPSAYPQQVSAEPVGSAPGYPAVTAAAVPAAKTSPWVWVLAGLAVLLLLGSGGVGVVYAAASQENDKVVAQGASIIDEKTDAAEKLAKTKSDLQKQVSQAQADVDEAQKTLDALHKCQNAIHVFGVANQAAINGTGTLAAVDAAFDAMVVTCGAR